MNPKKLAFYGQSSDMAKRPSMNELEIFILSERLDPIKTMNRLQDHCVISDNCVHPQDVGNADEAVKWLKSHRED